MENPGYRRPEILDRIALDRHAVIEASAGTGKTFTIEHLIVEILLNTDTRLEQILAVTFTEKAASELRARIRNTLQNAIVGSQNNGNRPGIETRLKPDQRVRLQDAFFSFDRAPIHTIHSFCHRVLVDLAFETGTRFGVDVIDGRAAFHEAFRAELLDHLAADEWASRLLSEWLASEHHGPDELETMLFMAHCRRYLESGEPARNAKSIEQLARIDSKTLASDLRTNTSRVRKKAPEALLYIQQALARAGRDIWALRRELEEQHLAVLDDARADTDWFNRVSDHTRQTLDAAHQARFAITLDSRVADAFLGPIETRMLQLKRDKGLLDFQDMPSWLWAALEGPRGRSLTAELRRRFRYGLIDEFQDTDDVQWWIFRRVFVEGGELNRLFVIGDPKQAIYSFRDADVFTYLAARDELVNLRGATEIPLDQNFRSTGDMIDAVNLIFDPHADAPLLSGRISYKHEAKCGRPELRATSRGLPIKPIALLSLSPGTKLTARRYRAVLGRRIARRLRAIIHGSNAITVADGAESRSVRAGDIYVLTRTLAESREMADHLRAAGVPCAFYKQDGLFQTKEAGHVLDVLRAVAEPHRRSHRLKAWATPFFEVRLRDLPLLGEVPASHPLVARILQWNALAVREQLARLFSSMMHDSGLAARLLLFADSRRELTNYEHIFEILQQQAVAGRSSLEELIEELAGWVGGRDLPPGEDPGVQRLESERDAVQIMTVHKAKGLEADVVVLFGGYATSTQKDPVAAFHQPDSSRRVIAGKDPPEPEKATIAREKREEDERLLYVGLTRARVKLFLALLPAGSTRVKLNGYYQWLNQRLLATAESPARVRFGHLFEIEPVDSVIDILRPESKPGEWTEIQPPQILLDDDQAGMTRSTFNSLSARHAPLSIRSYTSLLRGISEPIDIESRAPTIVSDGESETPEYADLSGGRSVGIFLHEVIEYLDLDLLAKAASFADWKNSSAVQTLFATAAQRIPAHQRSAWIERGPEIVFTALRSRVALGQEMVDALARCPNTREMGFTYPIPEAAHTMAAGEGEWRIERGLLVGSVDFVFRHRERIYFADWKSDSLASYQPESVAAHVEKAGYELQARIYTIGVVRLLGVASERDYDERFGGLVYVFLRGIKSQGDGRAGIYFHRPSWSEVIASERELMGMRESALQLL